MQRNISFSVGEYYHAYTRGNDKRKIFLDEKDYVRFLVLLYTSNNTEAIHLSNFNGLGKISGLLKMFKQKRKDTLVDIGAYCLMPNHIHLLLKEKVDGGISLFTKKLFTGYSMYFNRRHQRTGKLFDSVFKAEHADDDNYLKYLYAYIHLNPISLVENKWKDKIIENKVRAREFLKKYDYSSYSDYLGVKREEGKILNIEVFPEYFETVTDFDSMINEWINFEKI
jgi:putative transposase